LCKDYIEKGHNGFIGFESKPGIGSKFFFEIDFPIAAINTGALPLQLLHLSSLSISSPQLPGRLSYSSTGGGPAAGRTDAGIFSDGHVDVMVVDDSAMTRKLLVKTLESLGLTVDTCENGKEAVEKLIGVEPIRCSLVLMDKEVRLACA
jgi:hypothetical protein